MTHPDLMYAPVTELVSRLEGMTDDEIFTAMRSLEATSEKVKGVEQEDVLARIALVESEIERRHPGQILAPYRNWKRNQPPI